MKATENVTSAFLFKHRTSNFEHRTFSFMGAGGEFAAFTKPAF